MAPNLREVGTEGNGDRAPTLIGEASAYAEDNLRWRPAGGMDVDAVTEIDLNSGSTHVYFCRTRLIGICEKF
jgi:hypothetical protein